MSHALENFLAIPAKEGRLPCSSQTARWLQSIFSYDTTL